MKATVLNQLFNTADKLENAKERIRNGTFRHDGFTLNENDEIEYEGRIVVPKNKINDLLNELWENEKANTLGRGTVALYKFVNSRYINISRDDIASFLSTKAEYQITTHQDKVVNKPIVERKPNVRWQIDLIDVKEYAGKNKGNKYILNVVDVFSRKCWLRAIKKKEPRFTTMAFRDITTTAGIKPRLLQADLGTEWEGVFARYLDLADIKRIRNTSYSPNENAVVERSNKEVRKLIRAYFAERGDFKWVDVLPEIEENLNTRFHGTLKAAPNDVWTPDREPVQDNSEQGRAGRRVLEKARRKIARYGVVDNYRANDRVRVKMSAIFSNVRRLIKEGKSKEVVIQFTPVIFRVERVYRPVGTLERKKYKLVNETTGHYLAKADGSVKLFYASELVKANEESDMTMAEALELNRVDPSAGDIQWNWG